jgi:hypothetical protein
MAPRANPIIAPRKAPTMSMLSEDAFLVVANKKPTYPKNRVHKIRRRLIAGLPPGGMWNSVTHGTGNGKSLLRGLKSSR